MSTPSTINEPARDIPVWSEVDVAVIGGGTAGVMAAVGARRAAPDARVCLIERLGSVGGALNMGMIGHFGNRFRSTRGQELIGGAPRELIDRTIASRGTAYHRMAEALDAGMMIFFRDRHAGHAALSMLLEAGVELWLHTRFTAALPTASGGYHLVLETKSGRGAIAARQLVDCSGEADVARAVGATMDIGTHRSWGLLFEMAHVEVARYREFLEQTSPDCPEFGPWLARHLGLSLEQVEQDRYWREWLGEDRRAWRWRPQIMAAVDAGAFHLVRDLPGGGQIRYGWDGFWPEPWHGADVVSANVCMATGLDPTNARDVSKAEVAARTYAWDFLAFLRQHIPGFERATIRSMGAQTMSRGGCEIVGEGAISRLENDRGPAPDDAMCLAGVRELFALPLGMFIPKGVQDLLVAGKCAAGGYSVRASVTCMAAGYSCGMAAALAARAGVTPGELDRCELRKALLDNGVILDPGPPVPGAKAVPWPDLLGVPSHDTRETLHRAKQLS